MTDDARQATQTRETHPAEPHTSPAATYRARVERFGAERDRHLQRALALSRARLATFLAAVAFFLAAEWASEATVGALNAGGALFLVAFIVLVVAHGRERERVAWFTALRELNHEALHRLRRDWDALPVRGGPAPPDHPYAVDLDLFGHASVLQLLGTVATTRGRDRLAAWLLEPAPPGEIADRQAAVRELASRIQLRDELAARGRLVGDVPAPAIERFLAWAEDEPWLLHRPLLIWSARVIPLLTIGLIIAHAAGRTDQPWWIAPLAAAILLTALTGRQVTTTFERAAAGELRFSRYGELLEILCDAEFRAPALRRLQEDLSAHGQSAHRQIRRLALILSFAEARGWAVIYLAIQLLTLWDLHVLHALEHWQIRAGRHVRRWIDALARADALAAIAALAFDHPDWTFPEVRTAEPPILRAEQLGHPLLPEEERVANDVEVGPPGSFLLVTGSNMSGKSTLLRAIGVNVVLAQAGAPVCARSLVLPPLLPFTNMRIQDSLERGLSYFMAELQRLKRIVDAARNLHERHERTLLYLLDEILQGTNTAERQIAARRILRHLLDHGAIGAVTTHDLAIADDPELRAAARPVHFRETILDRDGRTALEFDYRLRPGVATSTNALKLMEIVGLE